MRSESSIKHQIKQVMFRHRKKWLRKGMARHPENCVYNEESTQVGCYRYCIHKSRAGILCDSRYGGEQIASQCPFFQSCNNPDDLKVEFDDFVESASKQELAQEFPDLVALLWTLGEDHVGELSIEEEEDLSSNELLRSMIPTNMPWYYPLLKWAFPGLVR